LGQPNPSSAHTPLLRTEVSGVKAGLLRAPA
jgi:hypothetical protein